MARILVIEDDPAVVEMLTLMIQNEGHDVEVVVDGAHAIERLDRPPPDLVLLDLMMPSVGGFDVLSELRARQGWSTIPVVIVTARTGDEDVWRGWTSGADYYLVKPFEVEQLRSVVMRLLAERVTP